MVARYIFELLILYLFLNIIHNTVLHKSACEHGYFTKSPLAEHVWQEGNHVIHWNQVKLLDFSQGMVERRVKEAIYINMSPNNLTMNTDSGMELPPLVLRAARGHSHK